MTVAARESVRERGRKTERETERKVRERERDGFMGTWGPTEEEVYLVGLITVMI